MAQRLLGLTRQRRVPLLHRRIRLTTLPATKKKQGQGKVVPAAKLTSVVDFKDLSE